MVGLIIPFCFYDGLGKSRCDEIRREGSRSQNVRVVESAIRGPNIDAVVRFGYK